MLRCEGCVVRAGTFRLEIDRLLVAPGEHCLVVGPSGAGKSLVLRAIAGLVRPEAGTIQLRGEDAASLAVERRRVGLVFQQYSLFPHLSVLDNVAFGVRARGTRRGDARSEAVTVLERLGIAHLAKRRPATLSGGEQQRVAIARALATGADLLLLDEPFAALDHASRAACRLELNELRRSLGLTVVEVTHALDEAGAHADRVVALDAGRIVADGPFEAVSARPPNLRAARALGLENLLPAPRAGGDGSAPWIYLPPAAVVVGPRGAGGASGELLFDGVVEAVEELGPARRVRLRLDGDGSRLTGFCAPGADTPLQGTPATGVVSPGAVQSLLD